MKIVVPVSFKEVETWCSICWKKLDNTEWYEEKLYNGKNNRYMESRFYCDACIWKVEWYKRPSEADWL